MGFTVIAAMDKGRGIGYRNRIPWRIPGDMKFFRNVTTKSYVPGMRNAVIMGRVTYESIPPQNRPLAGRTNVVLTRGFSWDATGAAVFQDFESALDFTSKRRAVTFVAGGEQIYKLAVRHPDCDRLILTEIDETFVCDSFFPVLPKDTFQHASSVMREKENGIQFTVNVYKRMRSAEWFI